jgi:hypothetical protein
MIRFGASSSIAQCAARFDHHIGIVGANAAHATCRIADKQGVASVDCVDLQS